MKHKNIFIASVFLWVIASTACFAQLKYLSANDFPLFGKISEETETRYERLPANLKEICRPPVWNLGKNTAGLYLRFRTDSKAIALKWTLFAGNNMNHMSATGIKGFDLYCFDSGKWTFVEAAQPNMDGKENETTFISGMDGQMREYWLNFPLYDGVTDLYIGVDSAAALLPPELKLPINELPVVCYGTSILQGGCASRPGMAHTNILARRFNRTFINLGFSGNGQLDLEIAELIASCRASLIILDFVPNASVDQMHEKMERFYSIIREKQPSTPILFVEDPRFPAGAYSLSMRAEVEKKNAVFREIFEKIKKNDRKVRFVSSEKMIGNDNEATVDGIHFTDLGFLRYADYLTPIVRGELGIKN